MQQSKAGWLERGMLVGILLAGALLLPEAFRARLWISGLPGPGLYPLILVGLTIFVGLLLLVSAFRGATVRAAEGGDASTSPTRWLPLAVGLSLLIFPLAMPLVGFRAITFLYALLLAIILSPEMNVQRLIASIVFAGGLAVGLQFLFAQVFRVVLPTGSLTGF